MLRSFVVLLSVLVAMSAQAEDASTPERKGEPTPAAASAGSEQTRPDLAARQPPESHSPPLSPNAQPAQPEAGSDATTPKEPNDCGMGQSFFDEGPTPVAIRVYEPSVNATPLGQDGQLQAWKSRPRVGKAGRCLRKYVIQLKSESTQPYAVKDAKLVGSDGEVLKVIDILSGVNTQRTSINVLTVERTKSVAEPNYRVAVELIGEDGRRIVLENLELP